ncbi:HET-domain-containing protein [Colletotrichum sublineola]|nr:HET-domain-containing protein [Colletotrichum sublineola]
MDHLASINWDKLPATFRDAITLTKNLGINYLWIDSLCIIQDDKKDWLDESMKMASIYRRATLVIAAASSEDSTQGLSNPERPESLTLCVPRYMKETSSRAVYNIAESIDTGIGIEGPLKKRAWAFQEWYLGRRKVFFTSKGIKWNCDGMECNERGSPTELMLWGTMSWKHCLEEYTSKLLTVPSDRLVALRGIVTEIQKSRNDRFVPEFGVWEDKLAEQILWRPTDTKHEDLAGLPSWCWAATGGEKSWLINEAGYMFGQTIESTVNTVNLRSSGSVNASGLLIKFTMAPLPLRECCVQHFENQHRPGKELPLESVILPSWTGEHFNIRRYLILNPRGKSDFLGIAIFDRCVFFSECFCFILASTRRLALTDPCHPDYGKNSSRKEEGRSSGKENSDHAFQKSSVEEEGDDLDAENDGNDDFNSEHGSLSGEQHCPIQVQDTSTGFEESGVKQSKQSYSGYVHRDTDACVDILNVARSEEVHWALLLQPVDDTLKRYTRVGVALLWPRALEKGEGEFTEFEIF